MGKVIRILFSAICVITILVCGGYLIRYMLASHQNSQTYQTASEKYTEGGMNQVIVPVPATEGSEEEPEGVTYDLAQVDFEALWEVSPEVCGWIQIPALEKVDYPILWRDNSFYLNHSWTGESSSFGAIFLEQKNSGGLGDCYSIIYGHNMKDGSMFGSLKKYADQEFYQENGGVVFLYLPEETRVYQIFSARHVIPDDPTVYTLGFEHDEVFAEYVARQKELSEYETGVEVGAEDSVITLSTCSGSGDSRFVVHAKLIDVVPN